MNKAFEAYKDISENEFNFFEGKSDSLEGINRERINSINNEYGVDIENPKQSLANLDVLYGDSEGGDKDY